MRWLPLFCVALLAVGSNALAQEQNFNYNIPEEEIEVPETPEPAEPIIPESEPVPDTPVAAPELPAPEIEAAPLAPPKPLNLVKLRGLNKVTARSEIVETTLGAVSRFGNLEIIATRCWQPAPGEPPETAVLMEVRELKPGEGPSTVFSGWMFASSPSLSSLEHPVYDLTVMTCEHREIKD